METTIEEINSLSRSYHRIQALAWLLEEGPLPIEEFRNRADASRTTVNRNLEALEERGWIRRVNREFRLTPSGEIVAEKFLELVDVVRISMQLRPVAKWLPPTTLDINLKGLNDATVITADPTDPYAPVSRHIDALESYDRFRCILPVVGLPAMKTAHARVVEDGCHHEIIISEDVLETLMETATYRKLLDEMLTTGLFEAFVCPAECRFYLGVTDTIVQVGVQDEQGVPQGLIEFNSPEAREWAEETYERYKEQSRSLWAATEGRTRDWRAADPAFPNVD